MKKSGRTAAGTQRWKCTICNASTTAATPCATRPPHPRTAQGRALPGLSRKPPAITTTDRAAHRPAALNDYATEYRTRLNQRTTNPVESINARVRDNLRHHRAAGPDHQAAIAEWTPRTHTRQPAGPRQILTARHAQGRPPRRRIPTTPTNARTRPAGWGTTPIPEEGLWTRKGWAGRTH